MKHPSNNLAEIVHQRARLGILAVLAESRRADFTYLRETLELTDGNLSRHLQVLEGAGLIEIEKVFESRRPRTWVKSTAEGRTAFSAEIASLQALLDRVRTAPEEES